jgi:hypothetical protein
MTIDDLVDACRRQRVDPSFLDAIDLVRRTDGATVAILRSGRRIIGPLDDNLQAVRRIVREMIHDNRARARTTKESDPLPSPNL